VRPAPARPEHLLDRVLSDVRTGRFEQTLAALTAAGAAITAAEIYTEHDSASFGNKMMWWPVVILPTAIPAGIAGVFSKRAAKTVLPLTSLAIVINGLQGTYLHWRGIAQKPGGWALASYNVEMGPPVFAPLLAGLMAPAVDCLQLDVTRCGGYTGWLRCAGVAAAAGLQVSAHCAPSLHTPVAAALPGLRHVEWFIDHARLEPLLVEGAPPVVEGALVVGSAPGHGMTLSEGAAEWRLR
jgi:hypothetical protein